MTGRRSQSQGRSRPPTLLALQSLLAALALACAESGDGSPSGGPSGAASGDEREATAKRIPFRDASEEAGLDFVHFNGMSGQYYFAETMGAGGALFDFDNDGDLDLYLVQGSWLGPGEDPSSATFPPDLGPPLTDRLYRNDLGSDGRVRFTDVTRESGLTAVDYGMGVAAGDYDNDGFVDLYVTNFGPNRLLRNQGDGSFRDVTRESGAGEDRWSVPAVFFDFDRDGWLDLYVGNYVDFSVATHFPCFSDLGDKNYCGPLAFRPVSDRLFRNRGDGAFVDVSGSSGIASGGGSLGASLGGALGAISADFDGDRWLDLYVGNDGLPNHLWRNLGDGRFENTALLSGSAVNADGNAEASMGIAVADHDGDGDEDLFVSHLDGETNTLYVNQGDGVFDDRSAQLGVGAPSLAATGFGVVWRDFDLDGWRDLLVLNGAVTVLPELLLRNDPYPLHQRNQLYWGRQDGSFRVAEPTAMGPLSHSEVSRAAIAGDLDNDGDLDLVITNNSGPARVWINDSESRDGLIADRTWLGLRLVQRTVERQGRKRERDALGARAEIVLDDGRVLVDRVRTEGGYASANDSRLLVTFDSGIQVAEIRIVWPDDRDGQPAAESFRNVETGAYRTLRRGEGSAISLRSREP